MPRVPNYQPGQVAPVRTTGERFQAPGGPGAAGVLAEAFAGASRLASTQDKINLENDETQSRLALANARVEYSSALDRYKSTKLGAARAGQPEFDKGLDEIRKSTLNSATSPRMRQMIEQGLIELDGSARSIGASHAFAESRAETSASFKVEQDSLIDSAVSSDNPAFREQAGLKLRDSVRRQLQFDGFDEEAMPDAYAVAEKAAMSKLHEGVLDVMFASLDPHLDEVAHYVTAYRDEMTGALYAKTMARMQGPMQDRVASADADYFMGLTPQPAAVADAGGSPTADRLNAITVQSESGGNPDAVSPVGARGLMQVMPATAKDPGFGIRPSNGTPTDDVRVGQEYRAVMEKRYGGDLAKMWAAYNWGPGNLDDAIDAYGADWLVHAPKETRDYVAKNVGALGAQATAYAPAARDWSATRQTAYKAIDAAVDRGEISPERAQRAREEIDRRVKTDDGLLADQRKTADESATTILANSGDRFRTSMIPRDTWNALGPDQQIQFQNIEKQLKKAEAPAANSETVVALHRMAAGGRVDQAKFAGLNLAKYKPFMTAGEFDELATAQIKAQQDLNNPKALDLRSNIDSAITRAKKWSGIDVDKDPTEAFRIRRYMEQRAAEESGRRDMGDADFDRLFRDATRTVETKGILWNGEKRSSQILSPNFRAQIVRSFRNANGRDPSDDEIEKAWEAMGKPGG
ncbi:transglycosylase SLT domain-containing protein [Novosphingobium sp. PY1]|uniref:Transglycosylase SLT domain-containing protein n=1 Tax=Ochrobactrum sp. PW1 TaxID=1882222 RepID=A0A292GSG1_9HYPH|nr:transglycosylase SLT domain-containing protein [Novosphingobium sp. PY1]BBA74426.1 hypothetical protein [Ochrobactrum sp. PW1]GFM29275.1 uncharacterized protein PY1_contig-07-201 [Novosphingobium sp. PY1]